MLIVRCRLCNKELESSSKMQICGCSNMTSLIEDKVSAVDLSDVIMVQSSVEKTKKSFFSPSELAYQESRKNRKIRKLDFEIR